MRRYLLIAAIAALPLLAQTTTARRSVVKAQGDATVASAADQARIDFTVYTRAATAQDAAAQNAAVASAVISALKAALGTTGDVQTTSYSLSPYYSNQGVLSGFAASNTVTATLNSISIAGAVIDAGIGAGATNVQSLAFQLKDPEPARQQALRLATAKARAHADAMAVAAGMRVGAVIAIVEGTTSTPIMVGILAADSARTPVVPGNVTTSATVTVEYEIVP